MLKALPFIATAVSLSIVSSARGQTPRQLDPPPLDCRSLSANDTRVLDTRLAGVPALLRVPARITQAPIVLWHGFGPPDSEAAMMAALPLDDVPALKVYLGLPLFSARAPLAEHESLKARQSRDYVAEVFEPVVVGATRELAGIVKSLRDAHCLDGGERISLVGFSAGGAAVLVALADRAVPIEAAVTINAAVTLDAPLAALERMTQRPYVWQDSTRAIARRGNAIARAAEIAAGNPPPALLIIHGTGDTMLASDRAGELEHALRPLYEQAQQRKRLNLELIEHLPHLWTTAPQADAVRTKVSAWLHQPDPR